MARVLANVGVAIQLQAAEHRQLEQWQASHGTPHQKAFIWTASVGQIIEKIDRARTKMEQIKNGSTLPRTKKKEAIM